MPPKKFNDKKPAAKKPTAKKPAAKKPPAKKPPAKKPPAKKKVTKKPERSSVSFKKPTRISNKLCIFLNKPFGTEMSRVEVTKHLTAYIRAKNLQKKSNPRKINADEKLKNLFYLQNDQELTYFNLQRLLQPHFLM